MPRQWQFRPPQADFDAILSLPAGSGHRNPHRSGVVEIAAKGGI
jgi:hypothetical protein